MRLINTLAYIFTDEFLIDNIYGSFINNTLLKGLEWYKDTQIKACNITQAYHHSI